MNGGAAHFPAATNIKAGWLWLISDWANIKLDPAILLDSDEYENKQ